MVQHLIPIRNTGASLLQEIFVLKISHDDDILCSAAGENVILEWTARAIILVYVCKRGNTIQCLISVSVCLCKSSSVIVIGNLSARFEHIQGKPVIRQKKKQHITKEDIEHCNPLTQDKTITALVQCVCRSV